MADATGVCYTQSGDVKRYESTLGPSFDTNTIGAVITRTNSGDTSYEYKVTASGYSASNSGTYLCKVNYGGILKNFKFSYILNKLAGVYYYVTLGKSSRTIYGNGSSSTFYTKLYDNVTNKSNYYNYTSTSFINNSTKIYVDQATTVANIRGIRFSTEIPGLGLTTLNDSSQWKVYFLFSKRTYIYTEDKTKFKENDYYSISDFGIESGVDVYLHILYVPKYIYLDTAWDWTTDHGRTTLHDISNDKIYSRIRTIATDNGGWEDNCPNFLYSTSPAYALVDAYQYRDHGMNFFAAPVIPRFDGFRSTGYKRSEYHYEFYNVNVTNLPLLYEVNTSLGSKMIMSNSFKENIYTNKYKVPFDTNILNNYFFHNTIKYFDNDFGHYRNGVTYTLYTETITPHMGRRYVSDSNYSESNVTLQGSIYWDASSSDKMAAGIVVPWYNHSSNSYDYNYNIPCYGILTGIKGWGSNKYNNSCVTISRPTYGGLLAIPYDGTYGPNSVSYGNGGDDKVLPFRKENDYDVIKPGSMIVGRFHGGGSSGITGVMFNRFYIPVLDNIDWVLSNWAFSRIYTS